jgi:hypothetical protein
MTCHHTAFADYHAAAREPKPGPARCQRDRVHVFVFNGNDPVALGDLTGLRDQLNACGYLKVNYGQLFHGGTFEAEARAVRCADPDARFVVVGYSFGAGTAEGMASRLAASGVPIDGLVEIAPVYLPWSASPVPVAGVARRVVVTPARIDPEVAFGAEVVRVPGTGHFSVPTHPATARAVLDLLDAAAARVPVDPEPPLSLPLIDDPAPIPWVAEPTGKPTPATPEITPITPIPPRPRKPVEGDLTGRPEPARVPPTPRPPAAGPVQ